MGAAFTTWRAVKLCTACQALQDAEAQTVVLASHLLPDGAIGSVSIALRCPNPACHAPWVEMARPEGPIWTLRA